MTQTQPNQTSKKRTIVIILIIAGIVLVGLFGFRTFRSIMRIRQSGMRPLSTDVELIRGWMTIPYISDTYRIPVKVLVEKCSLPPSPTKHDNLSQINRNIAPDKPGQVVQCIKDAVGSFQESHPTPPAGPHD
jgi:hypothetical protein